MRIKKVNIEQIKRSHTFSIPCRCRYCTIKKKYENFLNKKLKDNLKVPFKENSLKS